MSRASNATPETADRNIALIGLISWATVPVVLCPGCRRRQDFFTNIIISERKNSLLLMFFKRTTPGEWVVVAISVLIALLAGFAKPPAGGILVSLMVSVICFFIILIPLYVLYALIAWLYPKSTTEWGVILWLVVIVGFSVVILILVALFAGFLLGIAVSSPATVEKTEISQVPAAVSGTSAPSTLAAQEIARSSVEGWNRYTVPNTRLGIYLPKDWKVSTQTVTSSGREATVLAGYSPDLTTGVMVMAVDVSGVIGGQMMLDMIQSQGYIGDDMYGSLIKGMETGSSGTPPANMARDPNHYLMSGQPARKAEYDQGNSHVVAYIIVPDHNTMIVETLMTTDQATAADRSQGTAAVTSLTG